MKINGIKGWALKAVILIFILANTGVVRASSAVNSTPNIKGVILLDGSGTMKDTDLQNIRIDGFKLFVDMCRQKGDKIGL